MVGSCHTVLCWIEVGWFQDLGTKLADMNLSDAKEQLVSQENGYLSHMLTEVQAKNSQLQVSAVRVCVTVNKFKLVKLPCSDTWHCCSSGHVKKWRE
jgi:hypothetical protein